MRDVERLLSNVAHALREDPIDWVDAARAAALQEALRDAEVSYLDGGGLAHDHVRVGRTDCLVRVPKQSQVGLPAHAHLNHEMACFMRAAASGATPALWGTLRISARLPHGALLVDYIPGQAARLPADTHAIVRCLAAVHALPLPEAGGFSPLRCEDDPLVALRDEIAAQAAWLGHAQLHRSAEARICTELQQLDAACRSSDRPARSLIAFDAHPGNFVVQAHRAVLVDLEKCRYSFSSLDLAHATLYTSTTWDASARAVLSPEQVIAAYETWEQAIREHMPGRLGAGAAAAMRPWHLVLRRAMWLWSVTWCAKWRVLSLLPPRDDASGEDWSVQASEPALVDHVRERVDHYLHPLVVAQVLDEFAALRLATGTLRL